MGLSEGERQMFFRLASFLVFAFVAYFYFNSLHLREPLKPVLTALFYAAELLLVFYLIARHKLRGFHFFSSPLAGSLRLALLSLPFFALRLFFLPGFSRKITTAIGFIFVLAAFLGKKNSLALFKNFQNEAVYSLALFAFINFVWQAIETNWFFLSALTVNLLYGFFSLFFSSVAMDLSNPELPIIGIQPFVAVLYPECSGVQSLVLFSFLYAIVLAVDFKEINWRRAIPAYFAGMLGMYFVVLLRIATIILVGALLDIELATTLVHNAISLILFVAYFALFWRIAFPLVVRGSSRERTLSRSQARGRKAGKGKQLKYK